MGNAEFIVHQVLEHVKAEEKYLFPFHESIGKTMPEQHPVVCDRQVEYLVLVQAFVNQTISP